DVPLDGGVILSNAQYVVTQPSEGIYKAFSSTCTHQGCSVRSVADGAIHCPCHGASFSIKDGSVITGPATKPLPEATATLSGSTVEITN
ncbi:MAG: Rieske (2Fe-2S) protein, partial [Arachnia sp.]